MTEEEIWDQQQMRKAEERRQEDAEMERLEQARLARAERSPALTDEEREAIQWAATFVDENYATGAGNVLRGLLERLG